MHKDGKWLKQIHVLRLPRAKFQPTHVSVAHRTGADTSRCARTHVRPSSVPNSCTSGTHAHLGSETWFSALKEPGLLGEVTDSEAGPEKYKMENNKEPEK